MSINETIKGALDKLAPVRADTYTGNEEVYFTFGYTSIPADYGDDEPSHERFLLNIHLFAPTGYNTVKLRRETKRALAGAGTTWPTMENASDKDGQHLIFECEMAQAVGVE